MRPDGHIIVITPVGAPTDCKLGSCSVLWCNGVYEIAPKNKAGTIMYMKGTDYEYDVLRVGTVEELALELRRLLDAFVHNGGVFEPRDSDSDIA